MQKSEVLRKTTAIFLWLLIFICFITMVRCNNITTANKRHIEQGFITPQKLTQERMIAETACSFAREWATFGDLKSQSNYSKRLDIFSKTGADNRGTQECTSANSIKIDNTKENLYRVTVLLKVSRLTTIPEQEALYISSQKIAEKIPDKDNPQVRYWDDFLQTVEVTVESKKDEISIIGYPVIVSNVKIKSEDINKFFDRQEPPKDFSIFANQMLEMYYEGKDLSNYTDKKSEIIPMASNNKYKLKQCKVIGHTRDGDNIKALISLNVTAPSIDSIQQILVMEAKKDSDHWILTRLGAY